MKRENGKKAEEELFHPSSFILNKEVFHNG